MTVCENDCFARNSVRPNPVCPNGLFQKISIPNHGQHLGNLREKGISWTGILQAWGVTQFGIPNAWEEGGFSFDFPQGENSKSFA